MMRQRRWIALSLLILGTAGQSDASLTGPWFRYPCKDLGFQILVADDWMVTPVFHGLVFALQYAPEPYVRVAVGRISESKAGVDPLIASRLNQMHAIQVHRETFQVDGQNAIAIEGDGSDGPFRDVFITKDRYIYWIGFAAQNQTLWPEYSRTFAIILQGFHFL